MKDNNLRLYKSAGIKIVFGESFFLQHKRSKKFLSYSQSRFSTKISNNYVIKLEDFPNKNCEFKIIPAYKY